MPRLFSYPPRLWPRGFNTSGYVEVIRKTGRARWLWNSFLVATLSTALAVAAGVSGAYGLSRFQYRGKSAFTLTILTTQMMPPLVLIIPLYAIFVGMDLTDSITGLAIGNVAFSLPVVIWMMKSIFDAIPYDTVQGDEIILKGQKMWTSAALLADYFIVAATMDKAQRSKGIRTFIVEKGTIGLSFGAKLDLLGVRGFGTAPVFFDDCRIPRLGGDDGFRAVMHGLDGDGLGRHQSGATHHHRARLEEEGCVIAASELLRDLGLTQTEVDTLLSHGAAREWRGGAA